MKTRIALTTLILSFSLVTSGISNWKTMNAMPQWSIAEANNRFGFDLFKRLQLKTRNNNLLISPLSVATALTMTYNGAENKTQDEMATTLYVGGYTLDELNVGYKDLLNTIKSSDSKIDLTIANSLWGRKDVIFKKDFITRNKVNFNASIASLDFSSPATLKTINGWVNTNTKGKIPKIIDKIDPDMVLFLINTVYFKGQWTKPFDKSLTSNHNFSLASGSSVAVPMMSQSGNYPYLKGSNYSAIKLPYGSNDKGGATAYLFLPDKSTALNKFLTGFNYETFATATKNFRRSEGDIKIPRFKMEYTNMLNNALSELGMKSAFTPFHADFSGMAGEKDLVISEVKHKAVMEVNEQGTVASAATSVGVSVTSMPAPQQRFSFIADHPFVMLISDNKTGSILFIGLVNNPLK